MAFKEECGLNIEMEKVSRTGHFGPNHAFQFWICLWGRLWKKKGWIYSQHMSILTLPKTHNFNILDVDISYLFQLCCIYPDPAKWYPLFLNTCDFAKLFRMARRRHNTVCNDFQTHTVFVIFVSLSRVMIINPSQLI